MVLLYKNNVCGLTRMYVTAGAAEVDEMGYSMSRLESESDICDGGNSIPEVGSSSQRSNRPLSKLDHEIAQITKLRSGPHELLSHVRPGQRELPVSTVKMLARREGNYSGRGRFSSADCCHVLSRYLPVNGPWLVDQMNSRAYVSQFSADGSLFVAGFQVIYLITKKSKLNALRVNRIAASLFLKISLAIKLRKNIPKMILCLKVCLL